MIIIGILLFLVIAVVGGSISNSIEEHSRATNYKLGELYIACSAALDSLDDINQSIRGNNPQISKVVGDLKHMASRKQSAVRDEDLEAYKIGLDDGATELAKYILSEIEEEK